MTRTSHTPSLGREPVAGSTNQPPPVTFEFMGITNRTYSVLFSDQLETGAWTKLADLPARGSNGVVTVTDPGPSPTNRFYRVVVPRRP